MLVGGLGFAGFVVSIRFGDLLGGVSTAWGVVISAAAALALWSVVCVVGRRGLGIRRSFVRAAWIAGAAAVGVAIALLVAAPVSGYFW
jgi:hypothetical protein